MAFDAFIKIDGIEGESTDSHHQGWIELISCFSDMAQTVSSTASSTGGASAERIDFLKFGFTKLLDKASPRLALACADGTHIDTMVLELCRAGGDKMTFMTYKLTDCMISAVQASGSYGEHFPSEDIEIVFGRIEWKYTQQNRVGGGAMGNIAGGWDLERNARV